MPNLERPDSRWVSSDDVREMGGKKREDFERREETQEDEKNSTALLLAPIVAILIALDRIFAAFGSIVL